MSHVTDQAVGTIAIKNYEAALLALTDERNARVARAQAEIAAANEHYDREATKLARKIKAIRVELSPMSDAAKKRPSRRRQIEADPCWTQEDIDHYYALRERASS